MLNFTVPHLPHSLLFGLASALVVDAAERETLLVSLRGTQAMEGGLCALMIYGCYEVCVLVFVTALHASALVAIGWWKIASSNAITLVTVFGYFRYRHRQILPRFAEQRGSSMQKQLRHRRSSLRRWSSYRAERQCNRGRQMRP